jgi:hypothetical protein
VLAVAIASEEDGRIYTSFAEKPRRALCGISEDLRADGGRGNRPSPHAAQATQARRGCLIEAVVDLAGGCRPKSSSISKKAVNWHLDIGQIPPAAGFHKLHVVHARRRLSVMVLRTLIRCDTVQCGPVDDRNVPIRVNHASRQSGSCPILAALLIEVAAGTLDCGVVGLSPLPEQV